MGRGGASLEFGKIVLSGEGESIESLKKHLFDLIERIGYPESHDVGKLELDEEEEEKESEEDEEASREDAEEEEEEVMDPKDAKPVDFGALLRGRKKE